MPAPPSKLIPPYWATALFFSCALSGFSKLPENPVDTGAFVLCSTILGGAIAFVEHLVLKERSVIEMSILTGQCPLSHLEESFRKVYLLNQSQNLLVGLLFFLLLSLLFAEVVA